MSPLTNGNEECLSRLAEAIRQGDDPEVERLLRGLLAGQESDLFNQMGHLTRKLHDALRAFEFDSRIGDIAGQDLPDARARLDYVVTKTEESAHRTLDAIERIAPVSEALDREAATVQARWPADTGRVAGPESLAALGGEVCEFARVVQTGAREINARLTDVTMAQEYQDLTGQVLRRVIDLVQELETGLVAAMRLGASGERARPEPRAEGTTGARGDDPLKAEGPQVAAGAGVAIDQDDVDDLLSSLGF